MYCIDMLYFQLNAFQSDLAKEDIRFTERQSKLIEQQKQEKDGVRQECEVGLISICGTIISL